MRLDFLLLVLLIVIGALIYLQNDRALPFFSQTENSATTTTTSITFVKGWFQNLVPGWSKATSTDDADVAEEGLTNPTGQKANPTPTTNIVSSLSKVIKDINPVNDVDNDDELSIYTGQVTLKIGSAKKTDPDSEYVTLSASANNLSAIDITDWKLQSTVTSKKASLPEGNRYLDSENDRSKSAILIEPGEQAYIITGDTPLRVSFRENLCTGYLKSEGDFTPSLGSYCPLPGDELLQYGGSNSGNTKCSEFVNDIRRCDVVDEDKLDDANLSGSCEMFVENVLTYEGCVKKHSDEPDYLAKGSWRIYLNQNGELWRSTNEQIELVDSSGRVVDTLEY